MAAQIIPIRRVAESARTIAQRQLGPEPERPKFEGPWWDKPWDHTSATQTEAFRNCERYWYKAWIIGPRPDSGKGAKLGDEVHVELEHYVLNNSTQELAHRGGEVLIRPSKHKHYVESAASYLSRPPFDLTRYVPERKIELETFAGGPKLVGKIDLTDLHDDEPATTDYKTSKNIRQYGKKPAELYKHVQGVIYGHDTLTRWPELNGTWFRLLYLQTQSPRIVFPVGPVRLTREIVAEGWAGVLDTNRQMQALVAARPRDWRDVTPNFDWCDEMGGCPYRDECGTGKSSDPLEGWDDPVPLKKSDKKDFSTYIPEEKMENPNNSTDTKPLTGLAAKMQAKLAAQKAAAGGAPAPTPTPKPAEAPKPAPTVRAEPTPAAQLAAKGFTPAEIALLDEADVALVLAGKLTVGMLRQPKPGSDPSLKGVAPVPAHVPKIPTSADGPGYHPPQEANAVCPMCKGRKLVPSATPGAMPPGCDPSPNGFSNCPTCKAKGVVTGPVAATGQVLPPDATPRELQVGDVDIRGKMIYQGPGKVVVGEIDGKPHLLAEVEGDATAEPEEGPETAQEAHGEAPAQTPANVQPTAEEGAKRKRGRPKGSGSKIAEKMAAKAAEVKGEAPAPTFTTTPEESHRRLVEVEAARAAALDGAGTPEAQAQLAEAEAAARARAGETVARVIALPTAEERKAEIVEASRPLAEELAGMAQGKERCTMPTPEQIEQEARADMAAQAPTHTDLMVSPESIEAGTDQDVDNAVADMRRRAKARDTAGAVCTVYVDCMPMRGRDVGEAVDADEWLYPIKERVEQSHGWLDYRLKPFAEGKGLVVAAIRKTAAQPGALPSVVFVSSSSDLGLMFLEAIKPLKLNVIKGVK